MNTIAIILNVMIIILEIVDLLKVLPERGLKTFQFYTSISNVVTFISSIELLLFGVGGLFGPKGGYSWLAVQVWGPGGFPGLLRYTASCMMLMTFATTAFILVPLGGSAKKLLFTEGLLHHLVCPMLCMVSYVFFEKHSSVWIVPVIVTLVYGLIMLRLNYLRKVDGPYPFFRVHRQGKGATVMWMCVLVAIITALSLIVRGMAR